MGSDVSWIGCYSCRCPVRQPCTLLRTFLVNDLTNSKMHACGKSVGRRWVAYLHARAHWHLLQVSHLLLPDRHMGDSTLRCKPIICLDPKRNFATQFVSRFCLRPRPSIRLSRNCWLHFVRHVRIVPSNVLSANFEWAIEVFQPFDPNTLEPQEIQFIKSRSSTLLQTSWFSVTFPRSFIPS